MIKIVTTSIQTYIAFCVCMCVCMSNSVKSLWLLAGCFKSSACLYCVVQSSLAMQSLHLDVVSHDGASEHKRVRKKCCGVYASMVIDTVDTICLMHRGMFRVCQ